MTSLLPLARPPDPDLTLEPLTSVPSSSDVPDPNRRPSVINPFKRPPSSAVPPVNRQRATSSSNPFARPRPSHETKSFSRVTLLPSLISPIRPSSGHAGATGSSGLLKTPEEGLGLRRADETPNAGVDQEVLPGGSAGRPRQAWRMLWRGGVEIGQEGFRLDGITFFALLSFPPPTPSATGREINPFDNLPPIQPSPVSRHNDTPPAQPTGTPGSPFPMSLTASTDLCLSLESMRGRKFLQVRGVTELPADEVLEGQEDGAEVQMSISPGSPLLCAYFSGLLCRQPKLSAVGRTLTAVIVGLGDEGFDGQHASTILIYGQLSQATPLDKELPSLKLFVGRRKPPPPPPSAKKPRPGEPLPRAPLFFPSKQPKKPPPPLPFSRRALSRASSRQFSREPSVSNIYAPPVRSNSADAVSVAEEGSVKDEKKGTPGRRGEKRPRRAEEGEEDRRRKSGKIIPPPKGEPPPADTDEEEGDIFGRSTSRPPAVAPTGQKSGEQAPQVQVDETGPAAADSMLGDPSPSGKSKRVRVPQQILDNKATIRKQTLLYLEQHGYPREHDQFKDLFGMITKGTYFAFRNTLERGPLGKSDIQRIINSHLDMYISFSPELPEDTIKDGGAADEEGDVSIKSEYTLEQIKEEDEDEEPPRTATTA